MRDGVVIETRTPAVIEEDRVGWTRRRDQFTAKLEGMVERQAAAKAALGALVAGDDLDERVLKSSRAQRAGLIAESEELEAGLAAAEGRLLDLETERRAVEQRGRDLEAVGLIDVALAAARALDAAWTPAHERFLAFLEAQQAATAALGPLRRGHVYRLAPTSLLRVLLHDIPALTPVVGSAGASERVSVEVYLARFFAPTRQELIDGRTRQEPPQEATATAPKAEVPRSRAPRQADRDSDMCNEGCAEPEICDGQTCEVTRKRAATHVAIYHQRNTPAGVRSGRPEATA